MVTGLPQACLSLDRDEPGVSQLCILDLAQRETRVTVAGLWVEYAHWSPDGRSLLIGAAGRGADLSGFQGGYTFQTIDPSLPDWAPQVDIGIDDSQWRSLWICDVASSGSGLPRSALVSPSWVFAPGLLPQIADVAACYRGLCLVPDHLALSGDIKDAALGPALGPVLALAQYPRVTVKATSQPSYVTEAYPYPSLHAHIRRVVEAYRLHRVFFGD